jgi:hypothetical protein
MAQTKSVVRLHTTIDLGPITNLSALPCVREPAATIDSNHGRIDLGTEMASWYGQEGLPMTGATHTETRR